MITEDEVRKLAELARLKLSDTEIEELQKDFSKILEYVSQVQEVATEEIQPEVGVPYNLMREDDEPHESGKHSKDLIDQFPEKDGDYLKVKKIISQD